MAFAGEADTDDGSGDEDGVPLAVDEATGLTDPSDAAADGVLPNESVEAQAASKSRPRMAQDRCSSGLRPMHATIARVPAARLRQRRRRELCLMVLEAQAAASTAWLTSEAWCSPIPKCRRRRLVPWLNNANPVGEPVMHVQVVTYRVEDVSDADFIEANKEFAEAMAAVPGLLAKV